MLLHFLRALWPRVVNGHFSLTFLPAPWTIKPTLEHPYELSTAKMSLHAPLEKMFSMDSGEDIEDLQNYGERAGRHTYFGLALRADDLGEHRRGFKKDCCALPGLAMDFDIADSQAHVKSNLPHSVEEISDFLSFALPDHPPTIAVNSGYGLHTYWCFTDPWVFDSQGVSDADKAFKIFVGGLCDKAKYRGWELDRCDSVDRIWRLPGFDNVKVEGSPRKVELLLDDGPRFSPKSLLEAVGFSLSSKEGQQRALVVAVENASSNIDLLKERLLKLHRSESRALMVKVLEGSPLADEGGREKALFTACSILVATPPGNVIPPEKLVEILRPSIEAMQARDNNLTNPPPTVEDALRRLRDQQLDWNSGAGERAEAEAKVKAALFNTNKPKVVLSVNGVEVSAATVPSATESRVPSCVHLPYVDEEIDAWARSQNCSVEDFSQRWIITKDATYWLFCNGKYLPPVGKHDIKVAIFNDLKQAPIEWTRQGDNGKIITKTVELLLKQYATVARHLISDVSIQKSTFDAKTETFHEAVTPLRNVEPLFVPEIHEWLMILSRDEPLLIDWLSTVTDLDRQTAGLYLCGPKGAGKTMLAHGLARLWNDGPPTSFSDIFQSWNDSLSRCPLVLCDERPPDRSEHSFTSVLREEIGRSTRPLLRKFMPVSSLKGSLRFILAANNERLLISKEELDLLDLEATAARILYCPVTEDASTYLRDIGGYDATSEWVEGDLIAKHALWLRDNHQIVRGQRFLVEGHVTRVHQMLVGQNYQTANLCELLVRYLDNPKPYDDKQGKNRLIVAGEGRLLVNVAAFQEAWAFYMAQKIPATSSLSKSLQNISFGVEEFLGTGYRVVDTKFLFDWALHHGLGNTIKMRSTLDRKVVHLKVV